LTFWNAAIAILKKDLRCEFRTKEVFNSSALFALLVVVVFSMAFEPTSEQARALSGGLLWVAFVFSAMLALSRTFAREVPNDCMLGLQMAPIPPAAIYVGKLLSNLIFLVLLELILLPVFAIFYNVRIAEHALMLGLIVLLGSWGLAAVGTTFAGIATTVRLRELMLPVLLLPFMIPPLMWAAWATGPLLAGRPLSEIAGWLKMLAAYDIVFVVMASLLFPATVNE